jgi:hypothetical protein
MGSFSLNSVRFEDIRTGIVNFLKENNTFAGDFDFGSSNLGYQIDIASYVTMLLSYENTLKANNIFIDTTEIRKNAISIAKTMGYRPKRKKSARFTGILEFIGDSSTSNTFVSGDTLTIPARTLFSSGPNSRTFINLVPITLTFQNSVLLSGSFILVEGTFKKQTVFGTGLNFQSFTINTQNVENDNLIVSIRDTNTDSSKNVRWTQADAFFSTTDPKIYFVEEDIVNEKKPKILFGDGILGQVPTATETIEFEYLETIGADGNSETSVDFSSAPNVTQTGSFTYSFSNLSVKLPELQVSFGGTDNESLVGIQFNAPRFFSTGDRGVTKNDLLTLLEDFPSIEFFNVIGGNTLFENDDTKLGKTYIAAVPSGIEESNFLGNSKIYLSELEENEILPQLIEKTIIGTERIFFKPTYAYLELDPVIEIATTTTDDEVQNITAAATAALDAYNTDNLVGLGKDFRLSGAISALSDTSGVISAEIDVNHSFIVTHDSFYNSRESRMTLPIIFSRDANNNIELDINGDPIKTNFIKKRSDIIDAENLQRDVGIKETVDVTTVADVAGSLNNTYFIIYGANTTNAGTTTTSYYVWMNVADAGSDPAPAGIDSGIAVVLDTGDSVNNVAIAIAATVNTSASNHFTATSAGGVVTVTNVVSGNVSDATDTGLTGFTITITTHGTDSNFYNQFTLPISSSSIYGALEHANSDRYLYNIDVVDQRFIEFELIGPVGSKILTFDSFTFVDQNDITYQPNLFETSSGVWSVQLNGRTVATLTQDLSDEETFTLSGLDEDFLENTVGFTTESTEGATAGAKREFIKLTNITETDENSVSRTYYKISGLLSNDVFTDVRIWSKTKYFDVQFDSSTFLWVYTNLASFTDTTSGDVTLSSLDESAVETNFLQVTHLDTTTNIILSMDQFNGAFSLSNFLPNNDALNPYDQRNDLELTTNYTLAQAPGKLAYGLSSFSAKSATEVQTIVLNAKQTTVVTTIANSGNVLHGTWFHLYSALDETHYYVWFDGSGSAVSSDVDPAPSGLTGIRSLTIAGESAESVASCLATAINDSAVVDFTASVVGSVVTIVNVANGSSTNSSETDVSGQVPGFSTPISTPVKGSVNPLLDIALMSENDILEVTVATDSNNNGKFLIKSVDSTNGSIEIFNFNAVAQTDGVGILKHYQVATGTYGSFTVKGFDVFHDISIGTLKYLNGNLLYNDRVKGYTDLANDKIRSEKIKTIFNNYTGTVKMNAIGMVPIDLVSNSGLALGQRTDFDEGFSQSIQAKISSPVVKK